MPASSARSRANAADKRYLAIVYGRVAAASRGTIDLVSAAIRTIAGASSLRRRPGARASPDTSGLDAHAAAPVGLALLACRLVTGRMHQIRVHLAASGWPLAGDAKYGRALWRDIADRGASRRAERLHASGASRVAAEVRHPLTGAAASDRSGHPGRLHRLLDRGRSCTMRAMSCRRVLLLPVQIVMLAACARAAADRAPLTGSSKTLTVRGEYNAVAIDQIDGMAIRDGRLALRGPQTTVAVDLPPSADADEAGSRLGAGHRGCRHRRPNRHLHPRNHARRLHAGSARERRAAPLRTLGGRNGDDVLVFAWGENSKSFWGWVTISTKKK